ncbi:MAG: 16S rRNA (guanine(966)-N(2))-methyltransferase RsmD [Elusimicrobiota bacterium]
MLRIIAGKYIRRQLKTLPGLEVRPILSRIKKSLFDIMTPKLRGAMFLDLYAGSGSVGIEALSRGAKKAVFVDNNRRSVRIITQNLQLCGIRVPEEAEVLPRTVDPRLFIPYEFNIIFAGTPYHDDTGAFVKLGVNTVEIISVLKIFRPGAWVIVQHHDTEKLPGSVGTLALFRSERYGDTVLDFYRA